MLDGFSSPVAPPVDDTKAIGGNILIVDDTPENLVFLATLLTDAAMKVRRVTSGQMALSAAQAEVPDLVLLDIVMPGMSGYEVCELLKADKITCSVPVIFLSALDEELDKVQAFGIGAVDYITKPFQIVEVLARIETHLKLGRLQVQLQQQNTRLQQEINSRTAAESAVQQLYQNMETRVQERISQKQNLLFQELQSSIVAIQIALKELLKTAQAPQDKPHLTRIEAAAQRIKQLLEDLS